MAVKVFQDITIDGKKLKTAGYLPKGVFVTAQVKQGAEKLDKELQNSVILINHKFQKLKNETLKTPELKWSWLGKQINDLLVNLKSKQLITDKDINTDAIWPGIAQYLTPDLRRVTDKKRAGTKKDHLRKCWLFATLPDTDWFTSWSSWDAFIDRGEHIIYSGKLFSLLKKEIPSTELNSRDYQKIAKLLANKFPQKSKNIESMKNISDEDLLSIVKTTYKEFKTH